MERKKALEKLPPKPKSDNRSPQWPAFNSPQNQDSLPGILREANHILQEVKQSKVAQISSTSIRTRAKVLVKNYFQTLRPDFCSHGIETRELDQFMQSLMKITNSYTSKSVYQKNLNAIAAIIGDLEAVREYKKSDVLVRAQIPSSARVFTQNDNIITTLANTVPAAAISYKQILDDLQKDSRLSYRGTVAEMREVLREVLDYLAPDKDVMSSTGFKLEENTKSPTMKQKVRFIFKSRNKPANAIDSPEEATSIIDDGVAKLVRATYNRGSLATHAAGEGKKEALQIKMYLDTVLCDLLEIR